MTKENKEEQLHKCVKCGKMKKESEGGYVLEGTTFSCKDCIGKDKKKKKDGEVCEFC